MNNGKLHDLIIKHGTEIAKNLDIPVEVQRSLREGIISGGYYWGDETCAVAIYDWSASREDDTTLGRKPVDEINGHCYFIDNSGFLHELSIRLDEYEEDKNKGSFRGTFSIENFAAEKSIELGQIRTRTIEGMIQKLVEVSPLTWHNEFSIVFHALRHTVTMLHHQEGVSVYYKIVRHKLEKLFKTLDTLIPLWLMEAPEEKERIMQISRYVNYFFNRDFDE